MKNLSLFIFLMLISISSFAQKDIEDIVRKGIDFHDQGDYDNAIKTYKKALKIDNNSALVHYELALSYSSQKDYKKAIKHADVVLDQNDQFMIPAYILKGSALDIIGQTDASIKLFEKAIKKEEKHYLIFYNLALNYYKMNNLKAAEKNVILAIEENPMHSSSHFMLGDIQNQQYNKVKAILSLHYFLLLEPNTDRSKTAYRLLMQNFNGNISKDKDNPDHTIISISADNPNDEYRQAELMISLLNAGKNLEENKGKTEEEFFAETTKSMFTFLSELKVKKSNDLYKALYIPFFNEIAQSGHIEVYCNYISLHSNPKAKEWLENNESKVDDFFNWLKEQGK